MITKLKYRPAGRQKKLTHHDTTNRLTRQGPYPGLCTCRLFSFRPLNQFWWLPKILNPTTSFQTKADDVIIKYAANDNNKAHC